MNQKTIFQEVKESLLLVLVQIHKEIMDGTIRMRLVNGHFEIERLAKNDPLEFKFDFNLQQQKMIS